MLSILTKLELTDSLQLNELGFNHKTTKIGGCTIEGFRLVALNTILSAVDTKLELADSLQLTNWCFTTKIGAQIRLLLILMAAQWSACIRVSVSGRGSVSSIIY